MSFRFRKRIKIAPGLHINLSKGWPSLSIGGHGATINVGKRGTRATVGIPGSGLSWQFSGKKQGRKAVQPQAENDVVQPHLDAKTVQAEADIIVITKRMETVAKRLTKYAAGSTYWKKAAIEQARLLDKMLDVAKASENNQLIAEVKTCHDAWGNGNPHYRAALDSGMTITESLAMVLAGKQPDQNVPANSSNHPVTTINSVATTNNLSEPAVNDSSSNRQQLVSEQKHAEPSIEEPPFWPSFWKTLARNLILPVVGCGVIAVVYMIAASKAKSDPPAIVSATPTPETPAALPTPATLAVTPTPDAPAETSAPQLSTPNPSPIQTTPPSSQKQQVIQDKVVRKRRATHNSTRRPER